LAHVLEGALRAGSVVLDELPTVLRACLTIASPRSGVAESLLQAINAAARTVERVLTT
jgi:hypothetical protein